MARAAKKLFIGDANRVWQYLRVPGGGDIEDETVTFTVRTAQSYDAPAIGTETAMPWSAAKRRYEGVWDQDEALDLVDRARSYIHIQTLGHGRRLIPCVAQFNEGEG